MTEPTTEPRYALHLTIGQLTTLRTLLDVASASEADPDAGIFELIDQVRAARRQAASVAVR